MKGNFALAGAILLAPLFAQTLPPCPGAVAGKNLLYWMGQTTYPLCVTLGPTLQWTKVNSHVRLDVAPPAPPSGLMATQIGDFAVTLKNATTLNVGANCSAATPCNVRWGEAVARFTTPGLITLASGTGIFRVFVDGSISPPIIRAAVNGLTVACTGMACAVAPGNSFPVDSIPLASWTAGNGAWDVQGGVDYRAALSSLRIVGGPGISVVCLNGTCTISIDPNQ